jgi:hypothetical protein
MRRRVNATPREFAIEDKGVLDIASGQIEVSKNGGLKNAGYKVMVSELVFGSCGTRDRAVNNVDRLIDPASQRV